MRRFLAPPEQAAALAAVRNVRVAEEKRNKAEQAATVGLAWPQPKRRRGPPSRQCRFEEAICKAIDNGEGIGDINTADVPSWWIVHATARVFVYVFSNFGVCWFQSPWYSRREVPCPRNSRTQEVDSEQESCLGDESLLVVV